jgi:NAD(P) transhydrogenase subunit alpha
MAGRLAEVASMLYAKNLLNFLSNLWDAEGKMLKMDSDDEIITSSLITKGKAAVKPSAKAQKEEADKKEEEETNHGE